MGNNRNRPGLPILKGENMKAIKTMFEGIELKSRLEADIAYCLKKLNLSFEYEPKSFLLPSGIHYMPDFYIKDIHLWIEGRGYDTEKGEKQIQEFSRLIENGFILPDCTLGKESDFGIEVMPFEEVNKKDAPDYLVVKYDEVQFTEYENRFGCGWDNHDISLNRCSYCKRYYFIGLGSFQCRNCGAWDGDHHIDKKQYFNTINELKQVVKILCWN